MSPLPLTILMTGEAVLPPDVADTLPADPRQLPSASLEQTSSEAWATAVGNVESEFLAVWDSRICTEADAIGAALRNGLQTLENNPTFSAVLQGTPTAASAYAEYPVPMALLSHPPSRHAVTVLRTRDAQAIIESEVHFDPLSACVFRMACRPRPAVHMMPATERLSTQTGRNLVEIPATSLAPDEPGPESEWLRAACVLATEMSAMPEVTAEVERTALRAGLLQLHDFLEESHAASQSIEGQGSGRNGDYWHAIMHRREPDDGNSKYWFRRVGGHDVYRVLAHVAGDWLTDEERKRVCPRNRWDPLAFVDLCSEIRRQGPAEAVHRLGQFQWLEMQQLLSDGYQSLM